MKKWPENLCSSSFNPSRWYDFSHEQQAAEERERTCDLARNVAMMTAACKGLGRASAAALAAEGAQVVIASRSRERLEQTAHELQEQRHSSVLAVPTDLRHPQDIAALVTRAVDAFGGIDILVNNTGGPPAGTFETLATLEGHRSTV